LTPSLVRHDLDGAAVAVLDRQLPGLGGRLAATGRPGAGHLYPTASKAASGIALGFLLGR
jgi:hypothetical protein